MYPKRYGGAACRFSSTFVSVQLASLVSGQMMIALGHTFLLGDVFAKNTIEVAVII
jgi:hypothetical protein